MATALAGARSAAHLAVPNRREAWLPRLLAVVLLLVNVFMLIPIAVAAWGLLRGTPVRTEAYVVPLGILATGWILTLVLARRPGSLFLYTAALALWLTTAVYCLLRFDVF